VKIEIFDTTLRDGEQSPGVVLSPDEKLEIAEALARLGVDVIEAGFPIASPGDFQAVQGIARQVEGVTICALARAASGDIDRAAEAIREAERGRIHVFISTSDLHIEHQLDSTRPEVLEEARRAVAQAASTGFEVQFSPMDVTRADRHFSAQVCQVALEEGATIINIPDTVGYATPDEYRDLMAFFARELRLGSAILSAHTHDDLGLAVANAYAGVLGGATQVEAAVNGIGERAGNCATEEIIMLLKTRGIDDGYTVGADSRELLRTSRLVSRLVSYPIPANKAIVGRNAFAHESGIHQDGVLKERSTYEIIDPTSVGQESNPLYLGKHSGRHAFKQTVEDLGYRLPEDRLNRVFRSFKKLADSGRTITPLDIEALISDAGRSSAESYKLIYFEAQTGSDGRPRAEVIIGLPDGSESFASAEGDGPIDALFLALGQAASVEAEVVEFRVDAVGSGRDAIGEVTVMLERDRQRGRGSAASADTLAAAAQAWLRALASV
jgi:2-isopropylmalate synthase